MTDRSPQEIAAGLPSIEPPDGAACLTLWQPWAYLMFFDDKNVENRGWAAPRQYVGKHLWIHAGARKMTRDEREDFLDEWPEHADALATMTYGAIVGRTKLEGCHRNFQSRWATLGSVHWHMTNRLACRPIPYKGAQGIWRYTPLGREVAQHLKDES